MNCDICDKEIKHSHYFLVMGYLTYGVPTVFCIKCYAKERRILRVKGKLIKAESY